MESAGLSSVMKNIMAPMVASSDHKLVYAEKNNLQPGKTNTQMIPKIPQLNPASSKDHLNITGNHSDSMPAKSAPPDSVEEMSPREHHKAMPLSTTNNLRR